MCQELAQKMMKVVSEDDLAKVLSSVNDEDLRIIWAHVIHRSLSNPFSTELSVFKAAQKTYEEMYKRGFVPANNIFKGDGHE